MTNHKEYLKCGAPDLASSAQSWLNANDFEDVNLEHLTEPEEHREFPGLSQSWQCNRKRVYQALGYEPAAFEWSAKTKFDIGNYLEAYWMNALRDVWDIEDDIFMGQAELELEIDGHTLTGHPDGKLDDRGQRYLIEVKSMSQASFDARWNDTSVEKMIDDEGVLCFDRNDPDHWDWWGNYVGQTHAYAHTMGVEDILYLFIGRDYGVACAYQEYDPRIWATVEERWRTVLSAYNAERLPPRPESVQELRQSNKNVWKGGDSFPCGYCQFYKHCHEDMAPEKKIDSFSGKAHLVMNRGQS